MIAQKMIDTKLRELIGEYTVLAEKQLIGQPLSLAEQRLVAAVESTESLVPGALAELLLEYGVEKVMDTSYQEETWAIAASSLQEEETIYAAVQDVVRNNKTTLQVELPDGAIIDLFHIFPDEEIVEPCYCEGRMIIVDSHRIGKQVVTEFGGIFLPWEDLRTMSLDTKEEGRRIILKC